jgi:hypothetical protein
MQTPLLGGNTRRVAAVNEQAKGSDAPLADSARLAHDPHGRDGNTSLPVALCH